MKTRSFFGLALVFLLGLTPVVSAQNPPPEFIYYVFNTAKPGAVADYEDYVKKIIAGANKIGAPQQIITFGMMMGGPNYTYFAVVPFNKWGDMDGWPSPTEILIKAYGEIEAAKIVKAGRAAIEKSETGVNRLLPNLSTKPRAFDPATWSFLSYMRTEVEPEMASAYEMYLAKVKAVQEQAPNAPTAIRRVSAQGTASVYTTARPFSKHADREGWASPGELLRKAYGEAEARHLTEINARCIRKRDNWVFAYRPDLSRPTVSKATTND